MFRNSTTQSNTRLAKILARAAAMVGFAPFRALAQGCAMCYQNAAATGSQGRAALQHGILILLLPALSLFLGIFGLMYRRRNANSLKKGGEKWQGSADMDRGRLHGIFTAR